MLAFARLLMLCGAVASLGIASVRVASRLTVEPGLRVLSAAVIGTSLAILEALILGLVGVGENGGALFVGSAAVGIGSRVAFRAPAGPGLARQLIDNMRRLSATWQWLVGAAVGIVGFSLGYLLWRPYTPYDGLVYHLGEPAIWLHNGRPGSLDPTTVGLPLEAYPKNAEVVFGWLLGLAHSAAIGTLAMFYFLVVAVVAVFVGLRRLRVDRAAVTLAICAIALTPVAVLQLSGTSTDLPAMTWIAVTATLCLGAVAEPALLAVAILAAGLAIGTKLTAVPMVAIALVAAIAAARRTIRSQLAPLLVATTAALALSATWYAQTWAAFGSPLYPFYRFPSAGPLPESIRQNSASLLSNPVGAIRAAGVRTFLEWTGGIGLLAVGIVLALVVAASRHGPLLRRWLLVAIGAAVLELLLWGTGKFTGWPGTAGTGYLVLSGVRYLLPGLPALALPLVLTTRVAGTWRWAGLALLALAVIANIVGLHFFGAPYRPSGPTPLAVMVAVAVVAGFAGVLLGREPSRWRLSMSPGVLGVGAIGAVAALLLIPVTGYFDREIAIPQPVETAPLAISTVLPYLQDQATWRDGDQPVGVGPVNDALLAGPTFRHPLYLVKQTTSCVELRRRHHTDWLVLQRPTTGYDRSDCLGSLGHIAGRYEIYPPTSDQPSDRASEQESCAALTRVSPGRVIERWRCSGRGDLRGQRPPT